MSQRVVGSKLSMRNHRGIKTQNVLKDMSIVVLVVIRRFVKKIDSIMKCGNVENVS